MLDTWEWADLDAVSASASEAPSELAAVVSRLESIEQHQRRIELKLSEALRPAPKLLSKRAAAKMLGVDRGTTLEALVRNHAVRLVLGKIPLPDLERLLADGVPTPKVKERRRPPAPASEADAIRTLAV